MVESCDTCEFKFGNICAGGLVSETGEDLYGAPISYMKPRYSGKCPAWGISLEEFIG